ncbi:MAG: glycosyltransferase family 2 protein [Ignisphaera sp.]
MVMLSETWKKLETLSKHTPNRFHDLFKVSIIIRAFDAERYIAEAVKSVMSQTYEGPIEILICFDMGSKTLEALEIVNKIAQENTRKNVYFKIIKHPHMSPFRSLVECGLKNASGDYIGFLDHDNIYSRTFVEKLLKKMIEYDADVAVGRTIFVDEFLNPISSRKISDLKINLRRLLIGGNLMDTSSMILSKKCAEKLISIVEKYLKNRYFDWLHEDYFLSLIIAKEKFKVVFTDETFYLYRIRQASTTGMPRYNDVRYYFSLERSIKTLIAFYVAYQDKLTTLEKLTLYVALIRRMCVLLYGILKWIFVRKES